MDVVSISVMSLINLPESASLHVSAWNATDFDTDELRSSQQAQRCHTGLQGEASGDSRAWEPSHATAALAKAFQGTEKVLLMPAMVTRSPTSSVEILPLPCTSNNEVPTAKFRSQNGTFKTVTTRDGRPL